MHEIQPGESPAKYGPALIKPVEQKRNDDCFPTCVQSLLLTLYGEGVDDYSDLCCQLGLTPKGIDVNENTVKILQENFGVKAAIYEKARLDGLLAALKAGCFVIIEYQAPNSDYQQRVLATGKHARAGKSSEHGHYSVLFMAEQNDNNELRFWLMDPLINEEDGEIVSGGPGIRFMVAGLLKKRWEDADGWMMVVPQDQSKAEEILSNLTPKPLP